MSDLARRFMEALQRDESFDLTGFHPDEFATVSTQLVDTPACAAFFQALLDAGTPSSTSAAVSLVAAAGDPGVLAEVVCQLAGASQMTEDLVRRLHRAFLDTSGSRELYSGTRAQALLGALSLSTGRPSLMRQLQSHLLDVEVSDDGEYLRHVAKIDGLLLTHVQDNDLKVLLERLLNVPEAEDEASFALGLLAIAEALDASERALALKAFSSARNFMQRAMDASEKRQDARLYVSCLDVLIEFHEGTRDDRLKDQLAEIRQSAYEYSAFLLPSERPIDRSTWLGASLVEGLRWAELGERLAMLEIDLIKSAWLNAARVIEEELLRVFEASRSILKRDAVGGIEAVVRPRIVGAIQANRVQLAMLDQWVEENREGLSAPTALAIRADIDAAMEASLCRNPANAAAAPANAAAILANAGLPTELNACAQNLITTAVAEIEMARVEPIVLGVLETVHNELLKNPDYCDTGQRFFISILYYTIIFLASRENMSVGSVPGIEYLFNRDRNSPPLEADLHKDYFGFLQATPLRELAYSEARDVAHGRVDVYILRDGIKIVAELKKTHNDRTLEQLVDEYGLQATAYQRTNVRLCILMVLDLFDRGGGSDHLRNLVGVFHKAPCCGTATYSVVAFRVQGMKKTPARLH